MNLPSHILRSRLRALTTAFLCLLALAALSAGLPATAGAKVKVVAKAAGQAEAVRVFARTPAVAKRIEFFVDGRRQGVKRSVKWRRGRKGVLKVKPGRHRLTAVAIHPGGRVSRGVRIIRLARKQGDRKTGIRPAKPVKEPTPTPVDPDPLPPGVLFNGGFDNGFESWHVQALAHRVSIFGNGAFSGSAAHFEVHDGDVEPETGSERAEVSGPTFHEGEDLYVRDTIRVPSSSSSSTDWQLIQQLRENNWGGSPGMAVFLEDDLEIEIGAGDGYPMYWEDTELEPNRWYDLVYRVKLSQDPRTGFVEVWLDGVQQQLLNGATRMYGQTIQRSSNYIKAGIYRSQSSTGTTVVEHDNVIVGNAYDAVMAAG